MMKSSACFLPLTALLFCNAATRFPSAGSGKGFKPRAAYAYARGLRCGIPKQAVKEMEPCLSRLGCPPPPREPYLRKQAAQYRQEKRSAV